MKKGNRRSNQPRSPRTRSERSVTVEGVYSNAPFMHAVTAHVGTIVQVQTVAGSIFEGVLRTFSPQFDVVLELAHRVDPNRPNEVTVDTLMEKLIFKAADVITIQALNVDLEYATKDTFQTDTAISKFNGQVTERELEPWEGPCNGDELELEMSTKENGWDAHDMFRLNENKYGVTTSFDQSLSAYTVPLQKKDTKDYKDAEARAAQIAREIENTPGHTNRVEVENGDEEERFAAVSRVPADEAAASPPAVAEPKPNSNAYVPPAKRKGNNPPPPQSPQSNQAPPPPQHQQQQTPPPPQQQQQPQSTPHQGGKQGMRNTTSPGMGGMHHPKGYNQQPFQHQYSPQTPPPQSQMGYNPAAAQGMMQQKPMNNGGMDGGPNKKGMAMQGGRQAFVFHSGRGRFNDQPRYHEPKHHQPPQGLPPYQPSTSPAPLNQQMPIHLTMVQANMAPHVVPHHEREKHMQQNQQQPPQEVHMQQQQAVMQQQQNQQQQPQAQPTGRPPLDQRKPVSLPPRPAVREDQLQDLKKFNKDFNLVEEPVDNKPTPTASPAPKPQTPGPSDETKNEADKVTSTYKTSTLNPNAKEFVLNPQAKPFTPRSPSTPGTSRPHTPQTPQYAVPPQGVQGMAPVVMLMQNPNPYHQNQNRSIPAMPTMPISTHHRPEMSQIQVAAATGQPLMAPPIPAHFTAYNFPQAAANAQLMPASQGYHPPNQFLLQQLVRMAMPNPGIMNMPYHTDGPHQQIYMASPMAAPHPHIHHAHPPPNAGQQQPPGGPSQQSNQQTPSPSQQQSQPPQGGSGPPPQATPYQQPPPQVPPPQQAAPQQQFVSMFPAMHQQMPPPGSAPGVQTAQLVQQPYMQQHHQQQMWQGPVMVMQQPPPHNQ
ncbi:ataxin-2 homolog isoform X3 [Neocloeon triangulifer]|uniref:ataxin-2 homolog isoform X3 n=1 Tax=Neocloeon triangulifer TaxID=2078957 RepID=UPI00286F2B68|nr:ataxin-2 homolog isoform X3 [Neocloeon triangulifer]